VIRLISVCCVSNTVDVVVRDVSTVYVAVMTLLLSCVVLVVLMMCGIIVVAAYVFCVVIY